jgi:PAS domain S-box-containing protein
VVAGERPSSLRELLRELTVAVHRREPRLQALRDVIDTLYVAALVADTSGRYVAVNHAAATLTGYTASELTRLSVWQLTPNTNQHDARILWRAFLSRGEQYGEYQLLTSNKRVIVAEYAARTDVLPGLHLSLLRAQP